MDEIKSFYKCPECYYLTPWDFSLAQHLKRHHISPGARDGYAEMYYCIRCSFKTHLKLKLWKHNKSECDSKVLKLPFYKCLHCNIETWSDLVYRRHISNCKHEKQKFKIKWHNNHTSEKDVTWYKCSYCDAKSKRKSNLQRHIRIVHNALETAKRFKCDKCLYETTGSLREHMTQHRKLGETLELQAVVPDLDYQVFLWFSCEHCEFKCKVKSDLKKHFLYKHAGVNEIKWHSCEKCNFKAKELAGLRRHSMVHWTKEEGVWFYCQLCPYKARVKSNLKRHMTRPNVHQMEPLVHHQVEPFVEIQDLTTDFNLV